MLAIDREKKLQVAMGRRQRNIDQRCSRIHDVRWRFMGVDKAALDKQVQEKKERIELERKSEEAYEKRMTEVFAKASEMEKEMDQAKRQRAKELNEYRCKYQAPHTRDSFDLNGKEKLEKGTVLDYNSKCLGISSAQIFEGEDINYQLRRKVQVEQNRAWLDQQVLEKKNMKAHVQNSHEHYLQVTNSMTHKLCEKMRNEICEKLKTEKDIQEYNKSLAQQKAARELEEKKELCSGEGFTMHSYYLGPVLTNDRPVPRGSTGRHVVASMYKGFSDADRAAFRKDLAQQIEETATRKKDEAVKECEYQKAHENIFREGLLREREAERRRKDLVRHNMEENKKLAQQQKALKKEMKCESRFQAGEDFFTQFEVSP